MYILRTLLVLAVSITIMSNTGTCVAQQPESRIKGAQYQRTTLTEEFSFLIKDFKVDHQGGINNLNLTVTYGYIQNLSDGLYPDFRLIARDIETLLRHYPNRTDYWEVMNKKLTLAVLTKYPQIACITIRMEVSPSDDDQYSRTSITTLNRSKPMGEPIRKLRKGSKSDGRL
jgi:hypothetical protein